jgi:hypothetical protein
MRFWRTTRAIDCAPVPTPEPLTTTLGAYTHLFNADDHADAMAALDAMAAPAVTAANVIPLHG